MHVLVIEDHADLAENIGDFLEESGHTVDFAADGLGGLHLALTESYDVLILDLTLPGMDGLTVCRRLREEGEVDTPILMLTARDTLSDKLEGFDAGADDYLVKPFALPELEARLLALGRRGRRQRKVVRFADLELDVGAMVARRQGSRLSLNRAGLEILRRLIEAAPDVVSRAELSRLLWGDDPPESDALRTHVYSLRQAVDRPFEQPLIETVHGVGYRLLDPADAPA